ncbi:amino acid adenylation domain-containing protein [Spirosoma areae]
MNKIEYKKIKTFWEKNTEGLPTNIPIFSKRSQIYSSKKSNERFNLPFTLSYEQYLTAIILILKKYNSNANISIGLQIKGEVGAQIYPVTFALDDNSNFSEIESRIHSILKIYRPYCSVDPQEIVKILNKEKIINKNPLYDIIVIEKGSQVSHDLKQDITIFVDENGFDVEYSTRLYDSIIISTFGKHVINLIEFSINNVNVEFKKIDILSNDERKQILNEFNAPVKLNSKSVIDLFTSSVRNYKLQTAISFQGDNLSYADLDNLSNQYANFLKIKGVTKGNYIGISLAPSNLMIVCLLAIMKVGGIVVPIDTTIPAKRINMILEDAHIKYIVTELSNVIISIFEKEYVLILLDEYQKQERTIPTTSTNVSIGPNDGVYILFTSGSTGVPKGILMNNAPLYNLVSWQAKSYATVSPKTLQRTSLAFDVSFQEIFSTICFGGHLVIGDNIVRNDVLALSHFLKEYGIERVFLPMVGLKQLAEVNSLNPFKLESLREVICAGEQLKITPSIIRFFRENNCQLENQYGPTETHVITSYKLENSPIRWPELPPIGKPIDNVNIYILDRDNWLVPIGISGEIYVGGQALAEKYINNTVLSESLFLKDIFRDEEGARMYRTGDIGRWKADGNIEFLGREDHQVKIRGYRVELSEIELALLKLTNIENAVATADKFGNDETTRLIVYFTTKNNASVSIKEIRGLLSLELPEYMIPSLFSFIHLEQFPINSNGKIDRIKLSSLQSKKNTEHVDLPSRNELEKNIAAIWSNVLGVNNIQNHESFIELGGHSLLAIQIVSRLNEIYGISIPLKVILGSGNIISTAKNIENLLVKKVMEMTDEEVSKKLELDQVTDELLNDNFSKGRHFTLPNGIKILDSYRSETLHLYKDIFEHNTYWKNIIEYGDDIVIFDIGANIGLFSIYAHLKSPNSKIYAFEPVPQLFELLKFNLSLLKPEPAIHNLAISKKNIKKEITFYPLVPGMSTFYPNQKEEKDLLSSIINNQVFTRGYYEGSEILESYSSEIIKNRFESEKISCQAITLSYFMKKHTIECIDLLKIDVQKSELDILNGIQKYDWPKIKQIVVEVHDQKGRLDKINTLLKEKHFKTTIIQDDIHQETVIHFIYGKK